MASLRSLVSALCLLTCGTAAATPQVEDVLEYEGAIYRIGRWFDGLPLEDYWNEGNEKPKELKPAGSRCWRGYIAFWRVASDKLWLTNLFVYDEEAELLGLNHVPSKAIPIKSIFPDAGPAAHASWYTGDIELERSVSNIEKVEGGRSVTYSGRVLVIEEGCVKKIETRRLTVRELDNPGPGALRGRLGPPPLEEQDEPDPN